MARLLARVINPHMGEDGSYLFTLDVFRFDGEGVAEVRGLEQSINQTTYDPAQLNELTKGAARSAFIEEEVGDTVILSGGFS